MSIGIDKLAHVNNPVLSDTLLAHSAAEGTGVIAIGDLSKLLNAGNLKMPDSDETIAEHYRQFCNRNLLDNWYFANSVNQKGQMEYTGSGYTIDRWRSYGTKVSINDGYISLSTEGNPTFCQKSELDLYDKKLTFSVLLANGSLCTGTGILASGIEWKNTTLYEDSSIKLWLQNSNPLFNTAIDIKGNAPVDLVAAKLEFGSVQTLAHKENGVWVLNEIPDYTTELEKCQRYFWRYKFIGEWAKTAFIQAFTPTRLEGQFIAPVQMRTLPTVKTNIGDDELIATKNANVDIPVKYKGVIACGDTYRNLWLTFEPLDSSKVVLGDTYFLRNQNNKNIYLDFDANL